MVCNTIELLAPVGSMDSLRAAVQNGADAIYLGGKAFSARQYAENFDLEELQNAIDYAHFYGVQVYVAINTLLDNEEFPQLMQHLYELNKCDVDAIIVQDIGVASVIRKLLPDMELHASTQMTIHNGAGVRFLEDTGFSRVVLAREVSLKNVSLIGASSSLPLEVFVHGALCVSYSGQCLMSSMIGGRSGNRGRCAQPCRMLYTLVDSSKKEIQQGHLLSPRDLNMIENLHELKEAGVVSLKVEGRMKRPEYVATVIRNYRMGLNLLEKSNQDADKSVPSQAKKELSQIFNRDFTSGYYLQKPGKHLMSYQKPNNRGMKLGRVISYNRDTREITVHLDDSLKVGDGYEIWVTRGGRIAGEIQYLKQGSQKVESVDGGKVTFKISKGSPRPGDRIFKTMDIDLMEKARKSFQSPQAQRRVPISFKISMKEGERLRVQAWDDTEVIVENIGDLIIEKAQKHEITYEKVLKQMDRLGNTKYYLKELELHGEKGLMVPVSELNNLRRKSVLELEKLRIDRFKNVQLEKKTYDLRVRELLRSREEHFVKRKTINVPKISVTISDKTSLKAALDAGSDIIYFGGEVFRSKKGIKKEEFADVVSECHKSGAQAVLVVPRIFHEEVSDKITKYILSGQKARVDGFLAGNPGALQLLKELEIENINTDYTFNVFNDYTIEFLRNQGVKRIALSPELKIEQIEEIKAFQDIQYECIVHGSLPLMITEHCVIGNILGQGNINNGCKSPCKKEKYGLKDRMNMVFPIESDEYCRTHIYNPKTLSMYDRLESLIKLGISTIRIEGKKEEPYWIKSVVKIYREELKGLVRMGKNYKPQEKHKEILQRLSPAGYTTGHYYRGVE